MDDSRWKMPFHLVWTGLYLVGVPAILFLAATQLDPYTVQVSEALAPPSPSDPFGTDAIGRSYLARVVLGSAVSIASATVAVLIGLVLAVILGGVAGLTAGKWPDLAVRGVIALLYTVPFFMMVVAIAGVVKISPLTIPMLVGAVIWPPAARLVRTEVIRVRRSRFVLLQRAMGVPTVSLWLRTVMPVTSMPALAVLVALVPEVITVDVALSFFGLGFQPPTPTLGRLIYDGMGSLQGGWWLTVVPAVMLFGYCLGAHGLNARLVADLRRAART